MIFDFSIKDCIQISTNKPVFLKGLAMIFDGQENPFIIFRSKEIYI